MLVTTLFYTKTDPNRDIYVHPNADYLSRPPPAAHSLFVLRVAGANEVEYFASLVGWMIVTMHLCHQLNGDGGIAIPSLLCPHDEL